MSEAMQGERDETSGRPAAEVLLNEIVAVQEAMVMVAEMVRGVADHVTAKPVSTAAEDQTATATQMVALQAHLARLSTIVEDLSRDLRAQPTQANSSLPILSGSRRQVALALAAIAIAGIGYVIGARSSSDLSNGWASRIWSDNRPAIAACVNDAITRQAEAVCQVLIRP